jgi:hypothetical protein
MVIGYVMPPKLEKLPSNPSLRGRGSLTFPTYSPHTVPKYSYTPYTVYLNSQAQAACLRNEGSSQDYTVKSENAKNGLVPDIPIL